MSNIYVIGDIHGCSMALAKLLKKIKPLAKGDKVIFIGDYIDRGPDSKGVIEIILQLRAEHARVLALMGNHEWMLLNALRGIGKKEFLSIGGDATLKSYGIPTGSINNLAALIPRSHLDFFLELLPYWQDENYIYVHAGLQPGVHLSQQSPDWLFWARDAFVNSTYDFGKKVIYGHTPFEKPRIASNKIGIDTGAVYGNELSCLVLPEMKLLTVKNRN